MTLANGGAATPAGAYVRKRALLRAIAPFGAELVPIVPLSAAPLAPTAVGFPA